VSRPSLIDSMMEVAWVFSNRSTCSRLQVGCVITNEDMTCIDAIGYNGGVRGLSNECESLVPGNCGHIHAECNAIIKANYSVKNKLIFITHSPCTNCAKLIVNAGIKEVYYDVEYRDKSSLELLKNAGIKVTKV
jgi:dCMP deaminase